MSKDDLTKEKKIRLIKQLEEKLDDSYLTFKDGRELLDLAWKMQLRIEDLEKSRDLWRSKHDKLKLHVIPK